jgi:hypothetical protein
MDVDSPSAHWEPGSVPVFSRAIASRLLRAMENDSAYLEELFDIGWPKAPHRVLRNNTVANWEAAGRPATGQLRCISTLCDDAGAF